MTQIDDLKHTWVRAYEAISQGDIGLLDSVLARHEEVRTIGTDAQEWWDRAKLLSVISGQIEGLGGPFEMRSEALEAYRDGSVGWIADRVTAQLRDGTTVLFRVSGVLYQEDGHWRIVQMHWSIGASNQEVLGTELPT